MKAITNTLLTLLVVIIFSCTSENVQEIKEVEKEEIVKVDIEEKVDVETEPQPIIKKDSIVNVPDVRQDTTPIVGILKSVEESDFWGRVWLTVDVNGNNRTFPYYGEPKATYMGDFKKVENLIGKKILVKFRIEETIEEEDLHVDNKSIHGKYGRIKIEGDGDYGSTIEGTLLVHEYDKSGDLPSDYRIIDDKGDTITISGFVYDTHVALNGKKATVYYFEEITYIARSVVSLEKKEVNVDHYICYKNDKDTSQYIWVSFAKKEGALQLKYEGQEDAIDLVFDREDYFCDGCAHPTIETYYNEIYNDKINGVYKLTHSGVWDYVDYTRGKDGKVFNFKIDHFKKQYSKTPCF